MSEAKYTLEENGSISVQNLSAYWLPEMTIKELIKGSTYTISGEYVGTECIVPKLKRIMAHDADEFLKGADESADDTISGNFDEEFGESGAVPLAVRLFTERAKTEIDRCKAT